MARMWQALELCSFSHGYGQITYHIVLVPKYRYRIFYDRRVKKDCELILKNICVEQDYKIHAIEIVCSWNSTQALLYHESFNTWREAVLIDCSSFILNWRNAIGAETYGQVENSFDLSEMWLLTQSNTISRNLRVDRKYDFNRMYQGNQDNEDLMISDFRKTGRAARSIPHPLGWGGRTQLIFIRRSITEALFDLVGKIAGQQLIETENNSGKLVDNLISPSQPEMFTLIASFSTGLQTYPWLVRFNPSHTCGSKALE